MASIAVIVVNYNSADLAIEAVESILFRKHDGYHVEIHLVDNASPNGDAEILNNAMKRPGWQRVTFYPEQINHGFGRGNNVVLEVLATRHAPPDYVFLLNPDAALRNEALVILADFLETRPGIAIAGARILKPGDVPVTAAFRFPSIISEFSGALAFGPLTRLLARYQVPLEPHLPTGPVDWVAGAAMMGRFEALRSVGFFDPDYFLYYEEVDLMHRLRKAGWATWYVAKAELVHVECASTDVKSGREERRRRPAYWYESWRLYFGKNHGRAYALMAGLAWIVGAVLNHALARLRGKPPSAPLQFFRDFWAVGLRPILGLAVRARD